MIDRLHVTLSSTGVPDTTYVPVARITKATADTVFIRRTSDHTWRVLYPFGAQAGGTLASPLPGCSFVYSVTGTGTEVFDGVTLRRVDVGPIHHIYERMGYTWHVELACPGATILQPAGLRCYSDHQIPVELRPITCDGFVGIPSTDLDTTFDAYPNPGTTHFTIDLPPEPHTIAIFDATDRRVLHQRTTQERPVISTEYLPSGIYHLRVNDAPGSRWMKL